MNVGLRVLDVFDPVQDTKIPTWILYPTLADEQLEQFGPYSLPVARDATPHGTQLPLVILSHGNNSSPWTFRDLAAHLARAGFAVALLEHPGNSRSDGSLAGTSANLANRPRHLRRVLDVVVADPQLALLITDRVAVIGHSIGAYTGLALAGGRPTCYPRESPDGQAHPVPVEPDPRIRALVLLTPATVWLKEPGALAGVDLPILLYTGESDTFAPTYHADIVLRGVPDRAKIDHRIVANAGHFSFQSPFPPEMTRPDFPPSQDPPGFDRRAYQPILHSEVTAFLRDRLA
jgi:predicted dienelactone hydrolase